jgi:hypothetical protein
MLLIVSVALHWHGGLGLYFFGAEARAQAVGTRAGTWAACRSAASRWW